MEETSWEPWTAEEVEALLAEDVADLSKDDTASFALVKVPPRALAPKGGPKDAPLSHWIVAERAGKALYWDSVLEEFGVGRLRNGILSDPTNYDEFQWALDELFGQAPPEEEPKERW